jgi:ABC-2 type transport system permease protein
MALTMLVAMVRKDLLLFFADRRAVIMSFAVPIAIASFFGSLFSGPSSTTETARIPVAVVDQDGSAISRGIVAGAVADKSLMVKKTTAADAREQVRRGDTTVGVVIPRGFGDAAGQAFFSGSDKPQIDMLYDPSHAFELAMVRGILTGHVMEAVSKEMFGGAQGRALIERTLPQIESSTMSADVKRSLTGLLRAAQDLSGRAAGAGGGAPPAAIGIGIPYRVSEQAVTAGVNIAYNGYAHAFAGMGIQFLLFAAANLGVEILLERQRGLWNRLRSAPISRLTLLGGKAASMTIIALMTLLVSFAFAMLVFRVRIQGSVIGFVALALACSLMAATFGLLIAALGRTPAATRGVTTLAVLLMVMLGGAWVPTFIFPAWLQKLTVVVPARWAVDGLDAMTWRGIGISGAVVPAAVLLGFAGVFWTIAVTTFRWEEA